ncbi:LysE family translocator [Cytophagaceae bacterium DM2B3-1]|uniref:LysE family translocator n=1 Tax=Xanthocytophaga flava TaxID=3048013 RepID=A0ABT7CFH5_9BACT|nr:LysE family translocator [Xanthocytophaga flavus]MDJ1466485.1 LysE family translocator [Xanthocytophaga flavus]MDJ1492481.1 LysE family translocator [Xanthocytophaga flavus]
MFGIINYWAFLLAGILLNITPGSDTIYILGRSISQGKQAGIVSALGIATGTLVHTIFAAIGLSVILAQSAMAFTIVKYAGAAYLIFLGVKALLSKSATNSETTTLPKVSLQRIYLSGILTNVLNPKVALFFLAFLPQFIDPAYSNSTLSFLLLGLTFVTTGLIWCTCLAVFSARLSGYFTKNPTIKSYLDKATGFVFILLGIKLAFTKK